MTSRYSLTLLLDEVGQTCLKLAWINDSSVLCVQISQGLDLLDEMQARELEPSSFSLSPFISEFEWKTMIDEDGYMWGVVGTIYVWRSTSVWILRRLFKLNYWHLPWSWWKVGIWNESGNVYTGSVANCGHIPLISSGVKIGDVSLIFLNLSALDHLFWNWRQTWDTVEF